MDVLYKMKYTQFPRSLHMGGGSWSTAFEIGVVKALEERWEKETGGRKGPLCENIVLSGDSAGAAIAAGWCLGMTWIQLRELYTRLASRARTEGVWYGNMTNIHEEMLDTILGTVENPINVLQQRKFGIGITRFPATYETYHLWRNIRHLRHCLHCSFYVPLYCSYQQNLDGRQAIDGGFSNDGPKISTYDITVGRGNAYHISMFPTFSEVVYPPSNIDIDKKIDEGYKQGMKYVFGTPPSKVASRTMFVFIFVLLRGVHYIWHVIISCIQKYI